MLADAVLSTTTVSLYYDYYYVSIIMMVPV